MYLGWYDPDRKKPARQKLAEAQERYEQKFGRPAKVLMTSSADAEELSRPTLKHPGDLAIEVHARDYIARWTFYVGDLAG